MSAKLKPKREKRLENISKVMDAFDSMLSQMNGPKRNKRTEPKETK